MERDIGIPVKAAILIVLFHYFFVSNFIETVVGSPTKPVPRPPQELIYENVPPFFIGYMIISTAIATLLMWMKHFTLETIQRLVFVNCIVDAFFFAGVLEDVHEDFGKVAALGKECRERRPVITLNSYVVNRSGRKYLLDRTIQFFGDIEFFDLPLRQSGVSHQFGDDSVAPVDFLSNDLDLLSDCFPFLDGALKSECGVIDNAERVLQLVRDFRRESTSRLQLLLTQ